MSRFTPAANVPARQQRQSRHIATWLAAALIASQWLIPATLAGDCDPAGLEELVETTSEGYNWDIMYTDDTSKEPNAYIINSNIQRVINQLPAAKFRQVDDWGLKRPYLTSSPDGDILIEFEPKTGTYNKTCITFDPKYLGAASPRGYEWVINHELMHGRQMQYRIDAGADDYGGIGGWVVEGTARCLDDRYSTDADTEGAFLSDTNRLMTSADDDGNIYRDMPLTSMLYRTCLFWSYGCEQYGNLTIEPDSGVDFIVRLWEIIGEDYAGQEITDSFYSLQRLLTERGGPSLDEHWHRYTAAMLAREFNVSPLEHADWYRFFDESSAGGGTIYKNITRRKIFSANGPFPLTESFTVERYGHQFYEIPVTAFDSLCTSIGIEGTSTQPVAWTLIGVKQDPNDPNGPGQVVALERRRGTEFASAVLTEAHDPFTRLGIVVAGLEDSTDYEFTIDRGLVFQSIVRPDNDHPAYPGPANDPGRFSVRMTVAGPDGLKPDGVGDISVAGLKAEHFTVSVGGKQADVLSAGYGGSEYWLTVQAPEQDADGDYDLQVEMCGDTVSPTVVVKTDAVRYGDYKFNHMIVVDRSGSMSFPDDGSGAKLEAAQNVISLYTDAVNENDRLGLVSFNGDGQSCTSDATVDEAIGIANNNHRNNVRNEVAALTASGMTSIGDGLWRAQDEFDSIPPGDENINWIILLSDGDENEARYWGASIGCPGTLGDNARDRILASGTHINAIALGNDADTALMEEMGDMTEGDDSSVPLSEDGSLAEANASLVVPLTKAFMNGLRNARRLEQVYDHDQLVFDSVPVQLQIEVGESGMTDGLFYFNFSSTVEPTIEIYDPNGGIVTNADAKIFTQDSHKVYHMRYPLDLGTYTVEITPNADASMVAGLMARAGDRLQMETWTAQINTGGAFGLTDYFGNYEWGVPVRILATVTDKNGPCDGAAITATVIKPDGTPSCPLLTLYDDGAHGDGSANDGLYGAIFTDTTQAGNPQGVNNDDPPSPTPTGTPGLYQVKYRLSKPNGDYDITRVGYEWFNVKRALDTLDDTDFDGIPDTYEVYYGLDPTFDDSQLDPDEDGLNNLREFKNGCHPFDADTDNGGESDGSEVMDGLCPLDPADDRLPAPIAVNVENTEGDTNTTPIVSLANRLLMPVHPAYLQMQIQTSPTGLPGTFSKLVTLDREAFDQGVWIHEGLADGQTVCYRIRAIGQYGATTRFSPVFCGTARLNPEKPQGWIQINADAAQTDNKDAVVTMNFSEGVDFYQISNSPILSPLIPPLAPVPAGNSTAWTLDLPAAGQNAHVYVKFYNSAENRFSDEISDDILYDPNGDADNDGQINADDKDDDNDGLLDVDEVQIHGTNPYNPDTDGDGAGDGDEILDGCSNPLDPDTDGDGLFDGVDPSPVADADGDRDVDLFDIAAFQQCQGKLEKVSCACFDFDLSGEVDAVDYLAFEQNVAGPQN